MNAEIAQPYAARRTARARALRLVGPTTVFAGVVWAILQPWRITLLHPFGQGFWWLLIEPPLIVIAVGIGFWVLVGNALLEDLDAASG
jgi:ABC-type Co2+ transport system permease subunit